MWSASRSSCHAQRTRSPRRRRSSASTPTRCSRSSASSPRKSPRCAKPKRSDRETFYEPAMTQAAAIATPQSEKMLSRNEGSVGYVIFKNPERHNAVSLDMWQAAGEMLDDFRSDNNIKVVVVTGNGGKAFVSGADISRFEKERSSEDAVKHYNEVVDKSY